MRLLWAPLAREFARSLKEFDRPLPIPRKLVARKRWLTERRASKAERHASLVAAAARLAEQGVISCSIKHVF
jgi:hypothetical protein